MKSCASSTQFRRAIATGANAHAWHHAIARLHPRAVVAGVARIAHFRPRLSGVLKRPRTETRFGFLRTEASARRVNNPMEVSAMSPR
jgi:hypothetical protein